MDKKKLFLLIAILWIVIIFGFIAFKEFTLKTGKEILLKTRPIDPRDLFRGDYVILTYEISTLDLNSLQSDYKDFKVGDKVYASLKEENGYGIVVSVNRNAPEGLHLKGTVRDVSGGRLNVEYGIESYFVPEGRGHEIERFSGRGLDVKVSVDKFGNVVIKSLVIEGKDFSFK